MQTYYKTTLEDTLYDEDTAILTYKINYPCISSSFCSVQSINDFYYREAKNSENYCRTILYQQALENAKDTQARPFNSYEFIIDFTVTYNEKCILSLYTDTYTYTGGAHGGTKRTSNTWNLRNCTLLQLGDVYPLTPDSLCKLQKNITHQIAERQQENPDTYFDNYEFLIRENLNLANFYLEPYNGILYFQQYDIAPYSTGIPTFHFPIWNIF